MLDELPVVDDDRTFDDNNECFFLNNNEAVLWRTFPRRPNFHSEDVFVVATVGIIVIFYSLADLFNLSDAKAKYISTVRKEIMQSVHLALPATD